MIFLIIVKKTKKMNSKLKDGLEKVVKIGIPIAAGIAGVYLFEKYGISKMWQNYEFSKVALAKEQLGEFYANIQAIKAYATRIGTDAAGFVIPFITAKFFINNDDSM